MSDHTHDETIRSANIVSEEFVPLPWLPDLFHIASLRGVILSWLLPGSELPWKGLFERNRPFHQGHIDTLSQDVWYGEAEEKYMCDLKKELEKCVDIWRGFFQWTTGEYKCRSSPLIPSHSKFLGGKSVSLSEVAIIEAAKKGSEALEKELNRIIWRAPDRETLFSIILSHDNVEDVKRMIEIVKRRLSISPNLKDFASSRRVHLSPLVDMMKKRNPPPLTCGNNEEVMLSYYYHSNIASDVYPLVAENAWEAGDWNVFHPIYLLMPSWRSASTRFRYMGQDFSTLSDHIISLISFNLGLPTSTVGNIGFVGPPEPPRFSSSTLNYRDPSLEFIECILRGGSVSQARYLISLIDSQKLDQSGYRSLIFRYARPEIIGLHIPKLGSYEWALGNIDILQHLSSDTIRHLVPQREIGECLYKSLFDKNEWCIMVCLDALDTIDADQIYHIMIHGYLDSFIRSRMPIVGDNLFILFSYLRILEHEQGRIFLERIPRYGISLCHSEFIRFYQYGPRNIVKLFNYHQGSWVIGTPSPRRKGYEGDCEDRTLEKAPSEDEKMIASGDIRMRRNDNRYWRYAFSMEEKGNEVHLLRIRGVVSGLKWLWILQFTLSKVPLFDIKDVDETLSKSIRDETWSEVYIISSAMKNCLHDLVEALNEGKNVDSEMERCRREYPEEMISKYVAYCGFPCHSSM